MLNLITDDNIAALLEMIPRVTKSLPYVGYFMAGINSLFPDEKHEVVLQWFEKLSQQLHTEKLELINMMKMESVCVRYGPDVARIKKAIGSLTDIAKARDDKERHQERFKELCSSQDHALALDSLIDGLRGKGTIQMDILDRTIPIQAATYAKLNYLPKNFYNWFVVV